MMREILFKAKRKDNGEWVEGLPTKMWGTLHIQDSDDENTAYEIKPDTLCQYTGLTDKNGQKIWENDIVELPGEDGYFKCKWDDDTARYTLNGDGLIVDFDNYWEYEIEVIGNIFDNPELLEVEE